MSFDRPSLLSGVRDVAPVLVGMTPFALLIGVTAVSIGIAPSDVVLMSATVFAGASQIAALALIESGALPWVVVQSTALVNLRHLMYSASLAPWLARYGRRARAAVAFLLVDHAYAFAITRFARDDAPASRRDYLLGVGGAMWCMWTLTTGIGAVVGARLPSAWQLEFAIPLVFLALLAPMLRTQPAIAAAVTGGIAAVVLQGLPANAGLVVASLLGIAVGTVLDARAKRSP